MVKSCAEQLLRFCVVTHIVCETCPMELATCKVMLHMRLVCAGNVFVHVSSHSIASAIDALRLIEASRLKQNIIFVCPLVCLS